MELTGKAKQDFLTYFFKTDKWDKFDKEMEFGNKSDCEENALIVDWLDTVGINISVNYVNFYDELKSDKGFQSAVSFTGLTTMFRTIYDRNEATTNAITKANQIYNETR